MKTKSLLSVILITLGEFIILHSIDAKYGDLIALAGVWLVGFGVFRLVSWHYYSEDEK